MARSRIASFLLFALLLGLAFEAAAYDLAAQVRQFRLPNGMLWLVVKRPQAPVFSGVVMVRVGGVDEAPSKTGLAHMFEHMAFKGSSRIGTRDWVKEAPILRRIEAAGEELTALQQAAAPDAKRIAELKQQLAGLTREAEAFQIRNEVWELLMRNGANEINAYTSKDLTAYYASLPASRLELWAQVTSEMIFDPAYRDFYTERSVVTEERRTSIENSPDGALSNALLNAAFGEGPYGWPTIGREGDVAGLTVADARAFHRRHYVPANMVGVIVGDVTLAEVRAVAQRAFGRFPAQPAPKPAEGSAAGRGGERMRVRFDAQPSLAVGFHKPTLPDPAEYSFDVIEALLCEGRSSRLQQKLVFEERIAQSISCSDGYPGSRLPNLFLIWAEPLKGRSPDKVLAAVEGEIERLKREPVSEEELERVRRQVTASVMFALDSNDELAEALARFQTVFSDWRLLGTYPKRVAAVTAEDVRGIAQRFLTPENRVVIERSR